MSSLGMPTTVASPAICKQPGCAHPIVQRVCRGTKNPQNRGLWYEACGAPQPRSHFVRWMQERPPHNLLDMPSGTPKTLLEALSRVPLTPEKVHDYHLHAQVPSSPLKAIPITPLDFDNPPLDFTDDPPASPSKDNNLPKSVPQANTADPAPTLVRGGKVGIMCNASKCSGRGCTTCSFKYCMKCCREQQARQGVTCQESRHLLSDANIPKTTPELMGALASTTFLGRPLSEAHYNAQREAREKYEAQKAEVREQEAVLASLRHNITILYWKDDTLPPKSFTVTCKHYPAFRLLDCSESVRQALGVAGGGLIETFTIDSENKWWIGHELETSRNVHGVTCLLYRKDGVSDGVNMEEEVAKASKLGRTQKRPIAVMNLPDGGYGTEYKRPRVQSTLTSVEPETPTHSNRASSVTPTSTPQRITPRPFRPLPHRIGASASGTRLPSIDEQLINARSPEIERDDEVEIVGPGISTRPQGSAHLNNQSSSRHASWPLMYVVDMVNGLDQMETMANMRQEDQFKAVFHTQSFPKATHNRCSRAVTFAPECILTKYLTAGHAPAGQWKDFLREVEASYGGQKNVPKLGAKKAEGKDTRLKGPQKRKVVAIPAIKEEPDVMVKGFELQKGTIIELD
ncbi:hypothetical protein BDN72DRAFT_904848 [Pluteus cervinus]|uniref:Uncharacterized protein n=1 Tax=Pluteus cervinus TaxID=181527 RepID=A0ACD3A3X5_9AGAR|nr:hypothetical protein BDN72DRAFT_904848 [Pluteus cervinus]